jgi:DNA mismatch repair protein MutS
MGSRMLKSWLLSPKRERSEAQQRHHAITALRSPVITPPTDAPVPGKSCVGMIKGCTDVERITARIALRQVRPRELIGLLDNTP